MRVRCQSYRRRNKNPIPTDVGFCDQALCPSVPEASADSNSAYHAVCASAAKFKHQNRGTSSHASNASAGQPLGSPGQPWPLEACLQGVLQ